MRTRRTLLFTVGLLAAAGLVYRPFLSGQALAGRDVFRLYIADAAFLRECLARLELPLWIPYTRLGQPFAATLQSQAFYPLRALAVLLAGPVFGVSLAHLAHVAIAVSGTALAARRLGASRLSAALSGGLFGLGVGFTVLAYEQNVAGAASWTGFLVAAALGAARRPSARSAALLAAPAALSLLCGSPEVLLWQAALCAAAALAADARRRSPRALVAVALGLSWAFLLGALAALPAAELARESLGLAPEMRLSWSASLSDLASMVALGANWPAERGPGGQRFVLTLFQGAIAGALALAALHGRAARRRTWPLALAALGLALLSLGRHFPPAAALLGLFPLRLFRYPVKYALGAGFVLCLLAGLGADRVAAFARRGLGRRIGFGAAAGAAALGLAGAAAARALGARAGAMPGIALAAAAVLAAALGAALASRFGPRAARSAVALAAALEVLGAHLLTGPPLCISAERLAAPSSLAAAIRASGAPWARVSLEPELADGWPDDDPDAQRSLRRYLEQSRDALVIRRNVEERLPALEGDGAPEPRRLAPLLSSPPRALYDLASVGWLVRRGEGPPGAARIAGEPGDDLLALPALYRSATALPRAFLVHRAAAASEREARAALNGPSERFRRAALIELGPGEHLPPLQECDGPERAEVVEDGLSRLAVETDACGAGLLVVADAFFPGWQARVDGARAPVLRANYLVRAVPVSAGRHRVELTYRPRSFIAGLGLSAAAAFAWAAVVVGARRRRHPAAPPSLE